MQKHSNASQADPNGTSFGFTTYSGHDIRTVGLVFILPKMKSDLANWGVAEAQALSRMLDAHQDTTVASAKGKVVFVGHRNNVVNSPAAACFQVKDRSSAPVFCGNSTSAVAAILGHMSNSKNVLFEAVCDHWAATVHADVSVTDNFWVARQTWTLANPPEPTPVMIHGQAGMLCSFLNDYLIVQEPLQIPLETILSSDYATQSLRSKVALVDVQTHPATVRFYNCNGLHGSAPQTGLATLAILCDRLPGFLGSLGSRHIRVGSDLEQLPEVTREKQLLRLRMPDRRILLTEMRYL